MVQGRFRCPKWPCLINQHPDMIDAPTQGERRERPGICIEQDASGGRTSADLVSGENVLGIKIRPAFQREGIELELPI